MKICTFFGHRDCPPSIEPQLRRTVMSLIENEGVCRFLVGNCGGFDTLVQRVLGNLTLQYDIDYNVVCAYLPDSRIDADRTMMPPDFEYFPKRFAIDRCNRYMLRTSDYVVAYVTRNYGGAAKFAQMASRQHKIVMNIATAPPID